MKRIFKATRHLTFVVMIFAALIISVDVTRADTKALLIGVSDYDETIGLADLRGPANDVRLLQDVLTGRGVEDIRLVADGVDNAQAPTRQNILASFSKLAKDARDGDFIIIHMSGHGTRQPDANGDEADGFDEVFLPGNVTRAEPGTVSIPNAIVDEEIGDAVSAIRATGADVWLIMDSCHSGTGLRAGSLNTADRYIDPAVLGIDTNPSASKVGSDDKVLGLKDARDTTLGQFIAFYSAQADELAREVNFSSGGQGDESRGDDQWFGLFTAKLAQRLQTTGAITYRQLFQSVLADMNDTSVPGAARLQTPFWEGPLIDGVVLGGADTVGVTQYPVDGDLLNAGLVHGLSEGTVVELVADATAAKDAVIGFGQVEEVDALTSYIRPIGDDCVPDATTLCQPVGSLPDEARFARITAVPVDLTVTLSPIITDRDFSDQQMLLERAIADFNAEGGVQFAVSADDYDIEVRAIGDDVWFGHATQLNGEPLGLPWDGDAGRLTSTLAQIAYAERFAATMKSVSDSTSLLNPSPIEITAVQRASDPSLLTNQQNPLRECRAILRRNAYDPDASLTDQNDLKQCDLVSFAARGQRQGARDINRIHIDSKFCVSATYTRVEDASTTVPVGDDMVMCSDCPGGYSAGHERLFVVISEARANADQLNLEGVIENCGPASRTRSAGGQSSAAAALSDFLSSVGKPPGTRGAMGGFAPENVWVETFHWRVLPRSVALGDNRVAVFLLDVTGHGIAASLLAVSISHAI
ncbi:MAG: caspase family protein, partial [Pseudomonadota bacterium]